MEVNTWSSQRTSREQSQDFELEPLYIADIKLNEEEDHGKALTREFSFYFGWPTEQTIPEFLDTLKDIVVEKGDLEDREHVDNALRSMLASAYFGGSSGGKDLEVEERGYVYDFPTTLAKIMDDENYPERVGQLDLQWMSEDTISWMNDTPFPEVGSEEELYQIALRYTQSQKIPIEDDEYVYRDGMPEPSTEDIGMLLQETIPEYVVEQAAEQHGYDSTDAFLNEALDEAKAEIMDEYNQFRWKEGEELERLEP